MSRKKKKKALGRPVYGYIVLQQGGMVNGRVIRTSKRLRVGARNEKEAIQLCKDKVDKTKGYTVYYRETGRKTPLGYVGEDTVRK